ncbi:NtaA/DmoA family FMN-dependent monooxygenase [Rhodococcus koreensis]
MPKNAKPLHLSLVATTNTLHGGLAGFERAHGRAPSESNATELYLEYADIAERGNFTSLFLADTAQAVGSPIVGGGSPEPFTVLSAIAARTRHLGVIATASTSFYEPYNVARLLGSLDLVSEGRAGWNVVTSSQEAAGLNFGYDTLPSRDERYARADEFMEVVTALWSNRELRPNEQGGADFFADAIDYQGEHFRVRGPLNVAPSKQGRPMIGLAGGSDSGVAVAAKHADVTFTNATSKQDAASYRSELSRALIAAGRKPDSVPIMPMLVPFLGRTRQEAEDRKHAIDEFLDVDALAPKALAPFGISFSYNDLDDAFPVDVLPHPEAVRRVIKGAYGSYLGLHTWIGERPGVTVRQVTLQAALGMHHRKFIGSYDEFADDLESWFREGLVDGFLLMCPEGASSATSFVEHIVPRLVARGIYRDRPDNRPLRERF